MSHFYGELHTNGKRSTRCAHKGNGLVVNAAGWRGNIQTVITHDQGTGLDMFEVYLEPWHGSAGVTTLLARGELSADRPDMVRYGDMEAPQPSTKEL